MRLIDTVAPAHLHNGGGTFFCLACCFVLLVGRKTIFSSITYKLSLDAVDSCVDISFRMSWLWFQRSKDFFCLFDTVYSLGRFSWEMCYAMFRIIAQDVLSLFVGGFTLNRLLDQQWSQVSSLPPPLFLSRRGLSTPTASRFAPLLPTPALALSATVQDSEKSPVHTKIHQPIFGPQRNRHRG